MMIALRSFMVFIFLLTLSGHGLADEQAASPILYINEEGSTFTEVLEKISRNTGYQIELVGDWPDAPVNASLKGIPLETGLKQILRELRSISHVLILDAESRTVKIVAIRPGQDGTPERRIFAAGPANSTGEHGGTPASLESFYVGRENLQGQLPADMEMDPPSAQGPGLTFGELEEIKKNHKLRLSGQKDEDSSLDPPAQGGRAFTRTELEQIKEAHREYVQSVGPVLEISPPSGDGPGLTLGELEKLKREHASQPIPEDMEIEPPSADGRPGMTAGKLAAVKEAFKKQQELGKGGGSANVR